MTVIDSLSKGFQHVHRHWWVLLIPVLLDAFLWVGPHASVEDLLTRTVPQIEQLQPDSEEFATNLDTLMREFVPRYNAFGALRVGALGVPSLINWGGGGQRLPSAYEAIWILFLTSIDMPDMMVSVTAAQFYQAHVWQIPNEWIWLLLMAGLTVVGMAIGSIYMAGLSRSLEQEPSEGFWRYTWRFGMRFALFWALRWVVLIAAGLPLVTVAAALTLLIPGLGLLISIVLTGIAIWFSFYGIFFIPALTHNVSIWRAIWNSFNIVFRNFWPTVGLFVLINLIGGGLTILWQQLSNGSWLTLVAILGNAYVGTALVTASLVFYRDRYARWQEMMAELLRQTRRVA